jgi:hypothetical protein
VNHVNSGEPQLARPFAPHRLRLYLGAVVFLALFWVIMTIGPEIGFIPATFTTDVVANVIFTIPFVGLPLVVFWDAPDEGRSGLEKAAELILVYLPFTAASQITYELPFLIGNVVGIWDTPLQVGADPGWKWFFWQYAMADTRYWGQNPYMFGIELAAVSAGIALLVVWVRLLRVNLPDESRIRSMWIAFAGISVLLGCTVMYFFSEVRTGFANIGQGWYGIGFKFIFMNVAVITFPPAVLFAIYRQVDFLTRREGARALSRTAPVGERSG